MRKLELKIGCSRSKLIASCHVLLDGLRVCMHGIFSQATLLVHGGLNSIERTKRIQRHPCPRSNNKSNRQQQVDNYSTGAIDIAEATLESSIHKRQPNPNALVGLCYGSP